VAGRKSVVGTPASGGGISATVPGISGSKGRSASQTVASASGTGGEGSEGGAAAAAPPEPSAGPMAATSLVGGVDSAAATSGTGAAAKADGRYFFRRLLTLS